MGRFDGHKIGLREKETNKLIVAYPYTTEGADEQVVKKVKDWYYQTSCEAEDQLLTAFVDFLSDDEIKQYTL